MTITAALLHAAVNGIKIKFEYGRDADALLITGRKTTDEGKVYEYRRFISAQTIAEAHDPDLLSCYEVKKITTEILKSERPFLKSERL